jgi:hypothetical protein
MSTIAVQRGATSSRLIFGGAVALILLGLYVYAVLNAIIVVLSCSREGSCTAASPIYITPGMKLALTAVGGLVSALVITELAVTQPGHAPLGRMVSDTSTQAEAKYLRISTFSYLSVWTLTGLAFVVGSMQYPDVLPPLTDLGQIWLGFAVSASYSYFGIKPAS